MPPHNSTTQSQPTLYEVARLYVEKGLSTVQIGARFGVDARSVGKRLTDAGVKLRKGDRPRGLSAVLLPPTDELVRLYVEEGLSTITLGTRFGVSHGVVGSRLRLAGVELRGRGPRDLSEVLPPDDFLAHLYVEKGYSSVDLGARFGCHPNTIVLRLNRAGVELRGRSRDLSEVLPPDNELVRLHVEEGVSIAAIAARFGVSPPSIRSRLKAADVEPRTRSRELSDALPPIGELVRLYVVEGYSTIDLGRWLEVTPQTIGTRLKAAGVELRGP